MKNKVKSPNAWIVSKQDKGRKKIYNRNHVFLKEKESFMIEVFNPLNEEVTCHIEACGEDAPSRLTPRGGVIVKSNERLYVGNIKDTIQELSLDTILVGDFNGKISLDIRFEKIEGNSVTDIIISQDENKPLDKNDLANLDKLCKSIVKQSGNNIQEKLSNIKTYNDLLEWNTITREEYDKIFSYLKEDLEKHLSNKIFAIDIPDTLKLVRELLDWSIIDKDDFNNYKKQIFENVV